MTGWQMHHFNPTFQRGYARFLQKGNNPDDREYSEDADQIQEVLIHRLNLLFCGHGLYRLRNR